ncbi:MAG TPA: aldo/keto reductase [Phycisphaerales bacterium]|nr:aldo/keto reductase [Phycisphaerales bacterium]HMP37952.1 aldo/keto reductase [Phycisphaerales bacterium]
MPLEAAPRSLDAAVTLGRSGLRVSPFCLGTMTFGEEWGLGVSAEESFRVLDAYLERGGNFLDTANIYNKGHSEAIIGDFFADGPGAGRRDRVVIATKFMGNLHPGDPNGGGGGRKAVLAACEESLRRLRTEYIDLYWAHFHDPHTPIDETMGALDALVRQGKVRYVGLSDHPAWICVQAQYESMLRGWAPLVAIQIEYSLLQRTVEADLMPMARALGFGVTPWSPLRGGVLTGKFTRASHPEPGTTRVTPESRFLVESTYRILDELAAISADLGATIPQVALRWVQQRPGVSSTIIGARTVPQLLDNLGALSLSLSPSQIERLDELSKPALPFPHEFLELVRSAIHNGSTINGVTPPPWPLSPKGDADRW